MPLQFSNWTICILWSSRSKGKIPRSISSMPKLIPTRSSPEKPKKLKLLIYQWEIMDSSPTRAHRKNHINKTKRKMRRMKNTKNRPSSTFSKDSAMTLSKTKTPKNLLNLTMKTLLNYNKSSNFLTVSKMVLKFSSNIVGFANASFQRP